jgi:multidrug efflux pump subunit AcrA (membrane-fusion protein)
MFGRVRVPASPPYEGLLVPVAATATEQTRKYVLIVGSDNTVSQHYVTLGQATPDDMVVIKTGVGPDDRIIVNGLMRARPGQKVTPQQQGAAPPAPSAQPAAPK